MICFCWVQLPQYAARCIGAFVKSTTEKVVVVATRPKVPIEGMDNVVGCDIKWINSESEGPSLKDHLGEAPRALFVSGWAIPIFNRYRDEVRAVGGRVFAMSDGNAASWWVTAMRAVRFRLKYRARYDGYFVPGVSGSRLFRVFGVKQRKIATGLYSADASLFHDGLPLQQREKRMIFVGRFEPVKNVIALCKAFRDAEGESNGWRLDLYGCGSLREYLRDGEGVFIHDFLQPPQLADAYRGARVFVLPSVREPWGLVVHEAALSGCVLLLSNCIGAAEDLMGKHNGFRFNPKKMQEIAEAMRRTFRMTDGELEIAHGESLERAAAISLGRFVAGVKQLLDL